MSNYRRYFQNPKQLVFITFVTLNRRNILEQNIDILRKSFKYAKMKFVFDIVAISVLKNHCHLILSTDKSENIPKIIRIIKFNFSINIPEEYIYKNLSTSAIKRGDKGIWQKRYYDHIIRNENDLYKHIDYIHYNSWKHYKILPKDWQYSSFMKYVNEGFYETDWCNFEDKYNIKQLNYE